MTREVQYYNDSSSVDLKVVAGRSLELDIPFILQGATRSVILRYLEAVVIRPFSCARCGQVIETPCSE
jgi:hypothetical protein